MNNDLIEKEKKAIKWIKLMQPTGGDPYYGCYSGGKDSDVIYILSKLAEANIEWHHNLTTVDAPETVYYVRSHDDIKIDRPEKTMWQLIVDKGLPPTRLVRYCCAELKEHGGDGQFKITGVRWAESATRKENSDFIKIWGKTKNTEKLLEQFGLEDYFVTKQGGVLMNTDNDETRRLTEQCYRNRTVTLNPIVDWTDKDVWEFLRHYGCESNPLYQCGFNRIGCIGCPMAGKTRYFEFKRYPKYKENYIRAFDRMLENNKHKEWKMDWKNGMDVFKWWMKENPDQLRLEDVFDI